MDKSNEYCNMTGVVRDNLVGTDPVSELRNNDMLKNVDEVGDKCLTINEKDSSNSGGRLVAPINKGKDVLVRSKSGRPLIPSVTNAAINLDKVNENANHKMWATEDSCSTSIDDSVEQYVFLRLIGESSMSLLDNLKIGQIVIDLGCPPNSGIVRSRLLGPSIVYQSVSVPNPNLPLQIQSGNEFYTPNLVEKEAELRTQRKGIPSAIQSTAKRHGIKTRKDMKHVSNCHKEDDETNIWNLEVEVAKVIKKRVGLGCIVLSRSVGAGRYVGSIFSGQNNVWKLSQQVTKVIETGVALGFDFNGVEASVSEHVAKRIKEDDRNYLLMKEKNVERRLAIKRKNV
ncbi:hypothetical protein LWI28_000666 [Acer negundo]|uniref:Uncharacterized protein n=1 Tax=Acer negundo TaxID=4023 RepID=A0AAD5IGZ1_ACENE|nr:hypothetical protein LWI28_000666 [Acer negundo]